MREYAIKLPDGKILPVPTKPMALQMLGMKRRGTSEPYRPGAQLVSREVTDWAEETE